MMLWIVGAALVVMTIAFVLAPMLRRSGEAVGHTEGALAILADQIAEVERETADGLISPAEAEAAKVEIKRRMLAVAKTRKDQNGVAGQSGKGLLFALALAVPGLAGFIYLSIGAPGTPSLPFAERADERAEDTEVARLANELRTRLSEDPSGGPTDGWVLLGQTFMRMGRYGDAALAFSRIHERPDATSSMLTQYAEALIASEGGIVTNRAAVVLERAVVLDPDNPAGTYYRAQWLDQEGRTEEARALLADRIERAGAYQPWMDVFVEQINRISEPLGMSPVSVEDFVSATRGPTQEDMDAAAELTPEERMDFVRSMVDGLAARLQDEPGDLDGWLQLARAYVVLGEQGEAREAYEAASGLLQELAPDDPRRQVVSEGLAATGG